MQQKESSKKTMIITIVLLVIGIMVFFYFSGEPDDSSTSSLSAENSVEESESMATTARILYLLNQVSSIEIDPKFFESTVYKSLVDYTVVVPEQNVGRENPFVAVPGTFAAPAQTQ